MSEPTPHKPIVTWLAVTVDQATGVSAAIDLTTGAIVAIGTPDQSEVAIFWLEVDIGGVWYTLADPSGAPCDFRLLRSRAVPCDSAWTLPYTSARLSMPVSESDYIFQVCVQTI
jgi:hypothetical protein